VNIELNTQELDILTQSLEALQDNCKKTNRILARDKIDMQPIEELKNKMRREEIDTHCSGCDMGSSTRTDVDKTPRRAKNPCPRVGALVNESTSDKNELRFKEKTVVLNNQTIIELAYLTKDMTQAVYGEKLSFEAANCYTHCFYAVRSLLKLIDPEYLAEHKNLTEFYQEGHDLNNINDHLCLKDRTKDDCLEW